VSARCHHPSPEDGRTGLLNQLWKLRLQCAAPMRCDKLSFAKVKKMPGRVWGRPGIYLCKPKGRSKCAPHHQIGRARGYGVGGRLFPQRGTRLLVPPAHVPRMRSAMTSQACALASSSVRSPAAEIVRAISRHFSANCRYSSTVLFCWNLGLIGITTRGWPFCSSQSRNQDTGYRRLFPP
jgi:hypothetical protein